MGEAGRHGQPVPVEPAVQVSSRRGASARDRATGGRPFLVGKPLGDGRAKLKKLW